MPGGFFGNLIFAIIARMLCGNHLKLSLFNLRPSIINSVPLDRIVQRVYKKRANVSFPYWVLKINIFQRAPALTSQFTGEKGHCYSQEIVFSFLSYFRIKEHQL